jgi:catechol 2,3-dioxygenase-like lactoylglutathione lyase family enzyme
LVEIFGQSTQDGIKHEEGDMSVQFNHTIVSASNSAKSARFLTEILGLPEPYRVGRFYVVEVNNGVSLDFADSADPIQPQHYAFLIDEADFSGVLVRIQARGRGYWADPLRMHASQINHNDGGCGVYFADPDDHSLEVFTRP